MLFLQAGISSYSGGSRGVQTNTDAQRVVQFAKNVLFGMEALRTGVFSRLSPSDCHLFCLVPSLLSGCLMTIISKET